MTTFAAGLGHAWDTHFSFTFREMYTVHSVRACRKQQRNVAGEWPSSSFPDLILIIFLPEESNTDVCFSCFANKALFCFFLLFFFLYSFYSMGLLQCVMMMMRKVDWGGGIGVDFMEMRGRGGHGTAHTLLGQNAPSH